VHIFVLVVSGIHRRHTTNRTALCLVRGNILPAPVSQRTGRPDHADWNRYAQPDKIFFRCDSR